ncbi:Sodium- and chloride-dependent GABA transporter ine [Holothuria leucospilota]|uniref:Transporter n=1 Tax=Holothuria leucospilota TaxID=206669 RepID=A0A9Q1CFL7_HOLLE|nr:Sodium- and chloride-dependent GABA transporter ine [Holothuria leucospilota]
MMGTSYLEPRKRERWDKKIHFILVCIGYAVGLGNIWRFPYLCFKSGGGAFLIPYFIMLIVCGIPLLLMEFAVGQFVRYGPVGAFAKICPIFKGVGVATVTMTFLLTTYYNVIIAWAIFYLFSSFRSELPWASCNNTWNTPNCFSQENYDLLEEGEVPPNHTVSASQEFFDHRVIGITDGIEDMGSMRWELFGCLVLAWVAVYLCLFKGVKSSGRVVYFTALFPYLFLSILLITGLTLPGAWKGIKFLLIPKWEQLLSAKVWEAAAAQNFNSIGIAFGSMIAFASFNDFHNKSMVRDTLGICIVNSFTSIFASFVVFSVLGYIAEIQGAPSIDKVVESGPGLVFIVYPAAFPTMPIPQLWSILFFVMLVCLGIDSEFAMVEVVVTTIDDTFPSLRRFYFDRREVLVAYVCLFTFCCGIPNIMEGGIYFFQIMDWYTAVVSLGFVAVFEAVSIGWLYDARRLSRNVQQMTGRKANLYFVICWFVIAPILISAILIFSIIDYKVVDYDGYVYPPWAEVLGWFFAMVSIICIPLGAIHAMVTSKGSFTERLQYCIRTTINDEEHAAQFMTSAADDHILPELPNYKEAMLN